MRYAWLLLLCACAHHPFNPPGILGVTICEDDTPVALINIAVLGTVEERGTIAHERQHVAQAARFPNCQTWQAWYNAHKAEAEAEAFCADARASDRPIEEAVAKYALWLATAPTYHLRISVDSARVLIGGYCK